MDAINIKISKFGGLTLARQVRDLCVALGVAMTIEDTGGGDIATAAIVHLAHSTPERLRFNCSDCNSYVSRDFAEGAPRRVGGTIEATTGNGLGVSPDMRLLGEPLIAVG